MDKLAKRDKGHCVRVTTPKTPFFKSDIARARSDKRGKAPWALYRKRKMPFDPSLPRCGPTPG